MKNIFILTSLLLSINSWGAENVPLSAMTRATSVPTNTIFFASTISGSSSNTVAVPLEVIIHAGITNTSTINWTIDSGKMIGWVTNISSAELNDALNFATLTVNDDVYDSGWDGSTNVPTKNSIYDKIESLVLGGGGTAVYVRGVSVTNPNFANGTNMLWDTSSTTNIFGFPTNIVNSMISASANIAESKLDATLARDSEVTSAISALSSVYQPLDGDLTTIAGLADPNADRILFWDDSAGAYAYLTPNTGLSISGTSLNVTITDTTANWTASGTTNSILAGNATLRNLTATNSVISATVSVNDDAYAAGWNGSTNVPTKNAVYDKIESILISGGDGTGNWTASGTTNSFLSGEAFVFNITVTNTLTVSNLNVGTLTVTNAVALDGLTVNALAYNDTSWNGSTNVPTRDDIRDKITTIDNWLDSGTTNSLLAGIASIHGLVVTNTATFNGDLMAGATNVAGAIALKAPLASPTFTGNPLVPTASADDNDTSAASTAYVIGQINDTAFASSWNGVTLKAPSKNAVYDWGHLFDTDDDGLVNVLDYSAAGIANVNSSGVLQTPISTHAGLVGAVSDLNTATRTLQNATIATTTAGGNNTTTTRKLLPLQFVRIPVGTMMPNTNDLTAASYGRVRFTGNVTTTNSNFAIYRAIVPPKFVGGSSQDLLLEKLTFKTTGTQTGAVIFQVGMHAVADSGAADATDATGFSNYATCSSGTLTSPAANDRFSVSNITLTSWRTSLTAGGDVEVCITRNDSNTDAVDLIDAVLSYVETQ